MHETTAIVILVVVLGQVLIFTVAGLAMWIAGEFGERPRWWRSGKQRDTGESSAVRGSADKHDGLVSLNHDIPIAPRDPDGSVGITRARSL
ncbi:MAG TPA: hypothetical protein VH678_06605 [Xanthobacteraceae bacterium]|jgi:hypothetical protein